MAANSASPGQLDDTRAESSGPTNSDVEKQEPSAGATSSKHGWNFWIIFIVMCTASFTSALDTTIITTALPKVSESIGGSNQYVWIANSFVFSSTVFQPLYGQLSNIFGRRLPYLTAMGFFVLGAGICGGSSNVAMLIGGRTVQGIGSAGLFVLSDIIVSDLVPLRERAKYMGVVLSTASLGTILGPIIGGALAQASWRWCFYINLPLGIPSLVLMISFLRLTYKREPTWKSALARVDYLGNLIFIPSILAILLGLILGGTVFPWSSWRIIVPIVIGGVGWIAFHIHQASPICKEPSVPPHLFHNRTTCTAFILTFLANAMLNWTAYFMPFYFQSVRAASPVLSGVEVLPLFVFIIPSAMVAGGLLSKFGQYKPIHWAGFALISLGVGLFSLLGPSSNDAEWVFFQIFAAIGLGFVMTTLVPAVLAGLQEADVATATATFSFLRGFGLVWGITLPSIVFNNQFDAHSGSLITDENLRASISNGAAYGYAISGAVAELQGMVKDQVVQTYAVAIKYVWYVGLTFSLLGFLLVFVERRIKLRTELNTDFGLEKGKEERRVENAQLSSEKEVISDSIKT